MIGVGFLTLPTIGAKNGWIGIIIFVLIAQGTSMVGNMFLVKAFRATNCQSTCYPTIVETILGKVKKKFSHHYPLPQKPITPYFPIPKNSIS
jgi:amino acid permease